MRIPLILLILLLVFRTGTSRASNPDARTYDGFQVDKFELRGVPEDLKSALSGGLALAESPKLLKSRSLVFTPELLAADRERTIYFLARNGYPRADVAVSLEPKGPRKVRVIFRVRPGPPVTLRGFHLEGIPEALEPRMRKALDRQAGRVFSDPRVDLAARTIEARLRAAGHEAAKVRPEILPVDSTAVDVLLRAEPGKRYLFGETRASGIEADLIPLAVRTIDITPGTPYSPETLEDAQDNLRLLDMFRQIRLSTVPGEGDTLVVKAELSTRDPHTVEARVGYMSDDLLRARVRWAGHNTFRGGRGLEASASYTQFHRELKLSTWWPAFIGPRTREVLTLRGAMDEEDAYTQRMATVELASWYRKSFRTTYRAYVQLGYVVADFTSQYEDDFEGPMTILGTDWSWDTSDDRLRPTQGFVTWASLEFSPKILPAEAPYVQVEGGGSLYVPLPFNSVLALRLVGGIADPLDDERRLLPSSRFYAGGANSNRGFERRKLGPLYPDGDPAGGEVKLESLTEIRFPLVWRFRGAAFLDVGQVWSRIDSVVLDGVQPSAGWALMIDTPVGPVRVDMGYRLRDPGELPSHVFHFLIGHPF